MQAKQAKNFLVCRESKINPYPATIFCTESVVCFLCLLLIFKCKQYEPRSERSSLIWAHIVCNIGYLKQTRGADDNKSCEWQAKG